MKRYFSVIVIAFLMLFCGMAQALTWDQMSQQQKNNAILSQAMSYRVGDYGGICKEWVRTVVFNVSGRTIPPTYPDANGWQWASSPYVVQRYVGMYQFQPGDIVQMNYRNSNGTVVPHTAIVVGLYYGAPGGIVWIDSNWNGTQSVSIHNMGFDVFSLKVGSKYSVYNIK